MNIFNFIIGIIVVFISIVWIPIFLIFYPLSLLGKSLSFLDRSEQVGPCHTKYDMFIDLLNIISVMPYQVSWGLYFEKLDSDSRKKDLYKNMIVCFDDPSTHGDIDKEKIIKFISENKAFEKIFHFNEDISKEHYLNFFAHDREEIARYEKRVVWLYYSSYSYGSFIGMTKNKKAIFCINRDYSKFIVCKTFYEMPFVMFLDSQECTIGQIPWKARQSELDMDLYYKLKYYKDWLIENNITVKEKYMNMFN